MQDIRFKCLNCENNLVVDRSGIGMIVPCPRCGRDLKIPAPLTEIIINASFLHAGITPQKHSFYTEPQDIGRVLSDISQAACAMDVKFDFDKAELALNISNRLLREYIQWNKFSDLDYLSVYPARLVTGCGEGWEAPARVAKKWKRNNGAFTKTGLIAHVFDPIWSKVSVFRLPFPPFIREVKQSYRIEDVDATDAAEEGIHFDDFGPYYVDEGKIFALLSTVIFDLITPAKSRMSTSPN